MLTDGAIRACSHIVKALNRSHSLLKAVLITTSYSCIHTVLSTPNSCWCSHHPPLTGMPHLQLSSGGNNLKKKLGLALYKQYLAYNTPAVPYSTDRVLFEANYIYLNRCISRLTSNPIMSDIKCVM